MKRCWRCGRDLPYEAFSFNRSRADHTQHTCKECVASRTVWARREYREWLNSVKLASGCVSCGYSEHPEALQFDHLPEHEKLFNISGAWSRARASVEAEIAKCDVVCANCHAVRTQRRLVAA